MKISRYPDLCGLVLSMCPHMNCMHVYAKCLIIIHVKTLRNAFSAFMDVCVCVCAISLLPATAAVLCVMRML